MNQWDDAIQAIKTKGYCEFSPFLGSGKNRYFRKEDPPQHYVEFLRNKEKEKKCPDNELTTDLIMPQSQIKDDELCRSVLPPIYPQSGPQTNFLYDMSYTKESEALHDKLYTKESEALHDKPYDLYQEFYIKMIDHIFCPGGNPITNETHTELTDDEIIEIGDIVLCKYGNYYAKEKIGFTVGWAKKKCFGVSKFYRKKEKTEQASVEPGQRFKILHKEYVLCLVGNAKYVLVNPETGLTWNNGIFELEEKKFSEFLEKTGLTLEDVG